MRGAAAREQLLLELAAEALYAPTEAAWWELVASAVTGVLFHADVMALTVVCGQGRFGWFGLVHPVERRAVLAQYAPMDEVLMGDHPFSERLAAGPLPVPVQVPDLVSERQWRRSPAFGRMRGLTGGTRHMLVPVPRGEPYTETVSIVRAERDFDTAEMTLAGCLQAVLELTIPVLRARDHARAGTPLTSRERAAAAAATGLTARQGAVLGLLAGGHGAADIAARLGISVRTVYRHEHGLYRALGVAGAAEAAARGRQFALVPPPGGSHGAIASLSPRESSVLHLIACGQTTPEIAAALGISDKTVEVYVTSLLRKLSARTRAHAVDVAHRAGLLQ